MNERTFDDFDDFAKDYRSIHTKNVKISGADSLYFAEMKVQLLQQFEKDRVCKILDIGCGDGATAFFMQQYFPQWKIAGIDISVKSIEIAQERQLINASFFAYNGKHIDFPDEHFD